MHALLPCPFCGRAAQMNALEGDTEFQAVCMNACAESSWLESEDKARAWWNTRQTVGYATLQAIADLEIYIASNECGQEHDALIRAVRIARSALASDKVVEEGR